MQLKVRNMKATNQNGTVNHVGSYPCIRCYKRTRKVRTENNARCVRRAKKKRRFPLHNRRVYEAAQHHRMPAIHNKDPCVAGNTYVGVVLDQKAFPNMKALMHSKTTASPHDNVTDVATSEEFNVPIVRDS